MAHSSKTRTVNLPIGAQPIPSNPAYFATPDGRIYSTKRNKFMSPRPNKNTGYYEVCLSDNGVQSLYYVHRLVYEAFNGSLPAGMQVDHINGNRQDNRLSNLRLVTHRMNSLLGARRRNISFPVVVVDPSGKVTNYDCVASAAADLGVSYSRIRYPLKHSGVCKWGTLKGYKIYYAHDYYGVTA